MSEDSKPDREIDKAGRRLGRLWVVLVVAVLFLGLVVWKAGLLDSGSIDEQLGAIDAELAIPDSENAAVYYRRFFADPNNAAILDDISAHTPSAYCEPWADVEYPELAAKLKKHPAFIQTLIDISEMPKARFPVYSDPGTDWYDMLSYMRRVAFILSWAAANDLAEGRTEAALSKYECQLRLSRQLEQQPGNIHNLVGIAIEAVAFGNIKRVVMGQETMPEQLRSLETILDIPIDRVERHDEIAARVQGLIEQKEWSQLPLTGKLKQWLVGRKTRRESEERQRLIRLRLEATRRATPILFALRRHKDRTATWPGTLEDVEPRLPREMLIDPQNGGPFVYKRDGDGFTFYSKGPNGTDEGGLRSASADDWLIWPLK